MRKSYPTPIRQDGAPAWNAACRARDEDQPINLPSWNRPHPSACSQDEEPSHADWGAGRCGAARKRSQALRAEAGSAVVDEEEKDGNTGGGIGERPWRRSSKSPQFPKRQQRNNGRVARKPRLVLKTRPRPSGRVLVRLSNTASCYNRPLFFCFLRLLKTSGVPLTLQARV
ncbi:hypothetical protein VUR80DRAFT_1261 [Thermomyces stellatus]